MSEEEIYVIAEMLNIETSLVQLRESFSLDSEALVAMRKTYGRYGNSNK